MAVAKIEDIAVCIAVRSWEEGVLAVAVITAKTWDRGVDTATQEDKIIAVLVIDVAKTGGGDVDIATQKDKIFVVLTVAVITAKTDRLLAKNIAKKRNNRDKNIENNPF